MWVRHNSYSLGEQAKGVGVRAVDVRKGEWGGGGGGGSESSEKRKGEEPESLDG